jgi:4-diphosphocytidyl-2-C-methyl-D-erythritol kinase
VKEINIKAYAKINLYLDVVSKQNNGFHGIESVMQTVSLADDVLISAEKSDDTQIALKCDSHYAPTGEDNIAYRAAKLYLDSASLAATVKINIKKNIPSPAGMGGGSADAAAVLRGLNEIFGCFDLQDLEKIAANIGSDVPFCVKGGTQIASGRGEILAETEDVGRCFFAIGCGSDLLSTPVAYKMIDEKYDNFSNCTKASGLADFIDSMDAPDKMARSLYNIFESVTVSACPSVAKIKCVLTENGALGTLLCGSGPAVFGMFLDEETAVKAAKSISEAGFFSAVCAPIKI